MKKSSKLGLKGNVPRFGFVSYDKPQRHTMLMLWDGNRQIQEYTDEHVFTTVYEQDSFVPVARMVQLATHLEQKRLAEIAYETRRFVRIGESDVVINQRIADKSQPIIKIYHYHCNHLGTPQELSDDKGDIIWLSYDRAWGGSFDTLYKQQFVDNFAVKENELQPFKFQGQSLDIETGLHYNRFRYYDSDVGMFVSRDPIGLLGGDNVFQYAPNPVMWIDPFGLISIHDIALNKAKQLKISQGINDATKISVVRDKVTGKTYTGISGNPYQKISMLGTQAAIVTGPAGEEVYTNEYGDIKLQFHWDRYGPMNEKSSDWIRVIQGSAGGSFGSINTPRIGEEVLVDFINGDSDRPIVIGRLYNSANPPPWGFPAAAKKSGIKSKSFNSPLSNFNELMFDDTASSELVNFQAQKDLISLVKHDETRTVNHDRTTTIDNDETVMVKGNRTETVKQNETITIEQNRTETVQQNETITIQQNRTETVEQNETITINANRTESVKGNESISITGNRTKSVTGNETVAITGNQNVNISQSKSENVSQSRSISVTQNQSNSVGLNHSHSVGENLSQTVGQNLQQNAGQSITSSAGTTYVISAGDQIVLSVGSACSGQI